MRKTNSSFWLSNQLSFVILANNYWLEINISAHCCNTATLHLIYATNGTARHGTTRHGTTRHDTARHGNCGSDTKYCVTKTWSWQQSTPLRYRSTPSLPVYGFFSTHCQNKVAVSPFTQLLWSMFIWRDTNTQKRLANCFFDERRLMRATVCHLRQTLSSFITWTYQDLELSRCHHCLTLITVMQWLFRHYLGVYSFRSMLWRISPAFQAAYFYWLRLSLPE